jgi:hypothetical protein
LGFLLIWTSVMLLPTLLAEDAPHFLRAVGVLPNVILLPALGLYWLQDRIAKFICSKYREKYRPAFLQLLSISVPWLIILSGGLLSSYDYFVEFAQSTNTYHWFETGPVEIAQTINSLSGQGWDGRTIQWQDTNSRNICIDPVLWDSWKAMEFLIPSNSICFLPVKNPPSEPGTVFVMWPYDNWREKFGTNFPHPSYYYLIQGPLAQGDLDPDPFISSLFLYTEPLPPLPTVVAQFENGMQLHAALVETQKDNIMVKLWWTITHVQSSPSTVFVHYVRDDDIRIAQNDGQPGDDELPTTFWIPGDVIMDIHLLSDVVPDIKVDKLRIGLYDSHTGESIPIVSDIFPANSWYETNVIPIQ